MSSRNHTQWNATPDLQRGEWVDSRIYSDDQIFEDELSKIWKKTWSICEFGFIGMSISNCSFRSS